MIPKSIRNSYLLLVLLVATACSNSDMIGGDYTYYKSDWCVVQARGSQKVFLTDAKYILEPSESLDNLKAGDRYRVFYIPMGNQGSSTTIAGSELAKISNLQPVFVEDILLHSDVVSGFNDPIWFNESPFFGGGFINVDFRFLSSNNGIKHSIHLMQDSLVSRKMHLTFGHEANSDASTTAVNALASFPIRSLNRASEADSLIVKVRGDLGFQTFRLALKDSI